jgi:hypothetical protein
VPGEVEARPADKVVEEVVVEDKMEVVVPAVVVAMDKADVVEGVLEEEEVKHSRRRCFRQLAEAADRPVVVQVAPADKKGGLCIAHPLPRCRWIWRIHFRC